MKNFNIAEVYHRQPRKSDGIAHQIACKKSVNQMGEFLEWLVGSEKWDLKTHKNYLDSCSRQRFPLRTIPFFWQNEMVGMGFVRPSSWDHSAEIMYWVNTDFAGVGIGEHIAQVMIKEAFRNPQTFHALIKTDRDNVGSKRIMEKIGAEETLYMGYITHRDVQSNMILWLVDNPAIENFKRLDLRFLFNPWSGNIGPIRFQQEDEPDYSQVSDPSLIKPRKKPNGN
jgi:RimJ/RimL family protein N-acetyltransferase